MPRKKKETTETVTPQVEVKPEVQPDIKAPAGYIGKMLKINQDGAEFEGLCTNERTINGVAQVFVQLNGLVSRFFNVKDIVK